MSATEHVDDDFDAWFAAAVPPYRPRLLGQIWDLPGALPALKVDRYRALVAWLPTANTDPTTGELVDLPEGFTPAQLEWPAILRDLAGADTVDRWLELGLTEPQQQRVAAALVDRYIVGSGAFTALQDALLANSDQIEV